jgi:hypothetical protein
MPLLYLTIGGNYVKKNFNSNQRAVALLRSWLRNNGIPFAEGLTAPTDLVVGVPPAVKCVHVTMGLKDTKPRLEEPPGLNLDGNLICFGRQSEAIDEFWRLLAAIGIQEPLMPFERGHDIDNRRVNRERDGEDLIIFRHNTFARAPNPTPDQILVYQNVVGMATKVYWKRNRWLLKRLGFEYDEVLTYAWVWATSYIAHYETPPPEGDTNQKLVHSFLKQRFYELWVRMRRQLTELNRPAEDIAIALGKPFISVGGVKKKSGQVSALGVSGDYMHEGLQMPASVEADLELEERLAKLPHDRLVSTLKAAHKAVTALDKETREVAAEHLKRHSQDCSYCKPRTGARRRGSSRGKSSSDAPSLLA